MSPRTKAKSKKEGVRKKAPLGATREATAPAEVAPPERRFPRISTQTSVLIRKLGGPIKGKLSTTMVVGRGGCSFVQPDPQPVGSELYLSILVGLSVVEARVHVVYSRPIGDGNFEIGAEFIEVSKGDEPLLHSLFE